MGCRSSPSLTALVLFFACFLTAPLARQCFLYALLLAGLQVEGVPLYLLNNVFLLHFPFKATQCIFKGLTLLNSDFRQLSYTPKPVPFGPDSYCKSRVASQGVCAKFPSLNAFANGLCRLVKISFLATVAIAAANRLRSGGGSFWARGSIRETI